MHFAISYLLSLFQIAIPISRNGSVKEENTVSGIRGTDVNRKGNSLFQSRQMKIRHLREDTKDSKRAAHVTPQKRHV